MIALVALFASIFVTLTPVPMKALHCKGTCPTPKFELHGYGFHDERHWDTRPIIRMADDGKSYQAHIDFLPPFAPSVCEVFQIEQNPYGARKLAERPFKTVHDVHLEITGHASQNVMLGLDCWHIGKEDWTFSQIYQGVPLDAH